MAYYDVAPDFATLNLALEDFRPPVLIENPFTLGLYFLIISRSDVKHCVSKTELVPALFDTYLEGLSLHSKLYLHQY